MQLTGKQKSYLRGLAHPLAALVQIGKHRRRANTVLLTNIGLVPDLNLRVTPDTDPQDGLLDVTIISSRTLWDILTILFRMLTWRNPRTRRMKHFKAQRVSITADPPLPVQIDGEMMGMTPVEAVVIPQAVRLVVGPRYNRQRQRSTR